MRKILIAVLLVFVTLVVFANPSKEDNGVTRLAVMQGPTGFSSAYVDEVASIEVYPSPTEAIAKLMNGELDMAVLPANTAASMYNKGAKIKAVAIVGEGMLSIVGTDSSSKVLNVPGIGGTPDHMASLLYPEYEADYSVSAPAQLAQMVIANKVKMAILPQPFVNMVLSSNKDAFVISNVQELWSNKTKTDQYPMSILVVSEEYAKQHMEKVKKIEKAYKESIEKVLSNPEESSKKIEEIGIMKASLAKGAILDCALVYRDKNQGSEMASSYFEILNNLFPAAIGNKVPDKDFWL